MKTSFNDRTKRGYLQYNGYVDSDTQPFSSAVYTITSFGKLTSIERNGLESYQRRSITMYSVMQRMDARDRLNAERALKVPQENYLIERKERLKRIQKSELLEDDTLLRSIKKARTQPPWFLSRDVDNNTGGILEQ